MSQKTSSLSIVDAGPALNFLATNTQAILISVLEQISVPETVVTEIVRKAKHDKRFEGVELRYKTLENSPYLQVLSDESTEEIARVVQRLSGIELAQRKLRSKDLGEIMAIAHAVVQAESGQSVRLLIDDGDGIQLAKRERARLHRRRVQECRNFGEIYIVGTAHILRNAIGTEHIPDRNEMRRIYLAMRELDDGLVPLENTELLSAQAWKEVQ